jgi:hypothetical protein
MDWPTISVISLSLIAIGYGAFRLWRAQRQKEPAEFYPFVEIKKENTWFLLNLALANHSLKDVWVEESAVSLAELKGTPSQGFPASGAGVLRICELSRAGETLRIGLCQTLYDAAGRPQDEYTFLVSGTVKYRVGQKWYRQTFKPRRIRMRGPHPIEVRGSTGKPAAADAHELQVVETRP